MEDKKKSQNSHTIKKMKIIHWLEADKLELIEGWARDGLNNQEIAFKMNITRETLQRAFNKHPALKDAIENGRYKADIQVENALFKRAMGYDVEEYEADNNEYVRKRKRHIPGDTTAQIFWLKKRKPAQWDSDKQANKETLEKVKQALEIIPGKI